MMVKSVSCIVFITLAFFMAAVASAPYQELIPKKGYVPVYIRIGDTPLSEIHPRLVEAFHETDLNNSVAKLTAEPQAEAFTKTTEDKHDEEEIIKDETSLSSPTAVEETKSSTESDIASFDVIKESNENNNSEVKKKDETN